MATTAMTTATNMLSSGLFLLLCLACLALASPGRDAQAETKLRHGRYPRLSYIMSELSNLNRIVPESEAEPMHNQSANVADSFKDETDSLDDLDLADLEYDDLVDEEAKEEPYAFEDFIRIMVEAEADAEFNDDPSQEDYDMESDLNPQADGTTTLSPKWQYHGSKFDLRQSRGPYKDKRKQIEMNKLVQHTVKISTEAICKVPKIRLINIQSAYPEPSKTYIPHCTMLHRCGDDIGCCSSDSLTCAPKTTEIVELHFYTRTVGRGDNQIEKLNFVNHTECKCISKKMDMMVEDEDLSSYSHRMGRSYYKPIQLVEAETEAPVPLKRCQCPTEYSVHILDNGDCICDCLNKQKDCMRIKRGREYFGLKDRICINDGQCQVPTCEFGEYLKKTGRCPRRAEKSDEMFKSPKML